MSDEEHADPDDLEVPGRIHTLCHLCGGGRTVPGLTLAVVGGVPRTVDTGPSCPACDKAGRFPGIIPPV